MTNILFIMVRTALRQNTFLLHYKNITKFVCFVYSFRFTIVCLRLVLLALAILSTVMIASSEESKIRQRRAVLPLAYYAGQAVAPYVFVALIAAYGVLAVQRARVTSSGRDWDTSR